MTEKILIDFLAKEIKVSPEDILKALELVNDYKEVKIRKKGRGKRILYIPPDELKKVQKKILKWFHECWKYGVRAIFGLRRGSYIDHIYIHKDSRWFFSFDLRNAFYSADVLKIKEIISKGLKWDYYFREGRGLEWDKLADLIIKLTTYKNLLPQGAPTSPFLFWLALTQNSEKSFHSSNSLLYLVRQAIPSEWQISCYVDGFVISGNKPIPFDIQERVLSEIGKQSFKVHKIHHRDLKQGSPMLCGLIITYSRAMGGRVVLPKKKIRKWRGIIGRGRFDHSPELRKKIEGFLASLKPIYGNKLPLQISKSLSKIKLK